jgi:hypothetical protein
LYRQSRPLIDEAASVAERHPSEVADIYNFGGVITDSPVAAPRDRENHWTGGSVQQRIDQLTGAIVENVVVELTVSVLPPADYASDWAMREARESVRVLAGSKMTGNVSRDHMSIDDISGGMRRTRNETGGHHP